MKGYQGFTLGCLLLPVAALAQVPVMEGSGNTGYYPQQQAPRLPDTRSASAGLSAEGQLLLQLDQMQQEVSMLRGLLEEQEYRLKKLEQDQLDRYQDIDRRLSALSAGSPAPSGDSGSASPGLAPVTPSTQNQTSNTPPAEADPEREKLLYEAAFEQVRLRDFEKAEMAFNAFLRRYPQSDYAGNAQYWLGEVYLAQSDLDNAGKAFAQVISQYPGHRKEADALYKLADVERRLGNRDKAAQLYQEVLNKHGNSSAAQLARRDLNAL
ncbi:tol-pal system protein YbgF [Halopseudomonas formosensis]|jgi:tol-pal system protein YbgF|uniref:Cell division coordinator CpoB n=1 Tax=Halopseudomonas formosensis TaxID=1002526 RepID=A0ABU5C161_9GAMM|nr:tol-pal system protein YbgF [Halopseudomonas formosensis]MDX9688265.1 tol-pal system protein YbgF [Halopseudomonas formosensis]